MGLWMCKKSEKRDLGCRTVCESHTSHTDGLWGCPWVNPEPALICCQEENSANSTFMRQSFWDGRLIHWVKKKKKRKGNWAHNEFCVNTSGQRQEIFGRNFSINAIRQWAWKKITWQRDTSLWFLLANIFTQTSLQGQNKCICRLCAVHFDSVGFAFSLYLRQQAKEHNKNSTTSVSFIRCVAPFFHRVLSILSIWFENLKKKNSH